MNSNQALNALQGVRAPQAPPREVPKPREEDRVNLSAEAQQKATAEAARQADARRTQETQQQAAVQPRPEAAPTRATQERPRVDLLA